VELKLTNQVYQAHSATDSQAEVVVQPPVMSVAGVEVELAAQASMLEVTVIPIIQEMVVQVVTVV
jgi:hypothetical protein